MKPTVIIITGIMCAGKSTWLSRQPKITEAEVISFDNTIMDIFETKDYNKAWSYYQVLGYDEKEEIKELINRKLDRALDIKISTIYIDFTNLTKEARANWIKLIGDRATIKSVFIECSLDDALKRNENRKNKFIPIDVIKRAFDRLEVPTHDEGFDEVFSYDLL